MEYKYNLAKLQYDKEKIEELITRQSRRVGQVFPKKMEQEFWSKNLERARKHVEKYVWGGVLAYFIFTVVMVPSDYWIIDQQYFVHDFSTSIFFSCFHDYYVLGNCFNHMVNRYC